MRWAARLARQQEQQQQERWRMWAVAKNGVCVVTSVWLPAADSMMASCLRPLCAVNTGVYAILANPAGIALAQKWADGTPAALNESRNDNQALAHLNGQAFRLCFSTAQCAKARAGVSASIHAQLSLWPALEPANTSWPPSMRP